jgi:ADP-heptose:LPS heptosyltransferase
VIHPGALGDVLVALPALAHLGALGFRRILAAAPRLGPLLVPGGYAEAVIDLDGLGLQRLFAGEAPADLRAALESFAAVVSWLGAGEPAYADRLARLGRPCVVARARPPVGERRPAARHLLDTLGPLGPVPPALPPVRLGVAADAREEAMEWLGVRGVRAGQAIVLHPGAGSVTKVWSGFGALARRLAARRQPVVVTGGPADGQVLEGLRRAGALAGTHVRPDATLPQLAALVALARGFVGNDSGPTHLAAAVGCPTLALFGPSDPLVWAPPGAHVRVLAGGQAAGDAAWAGLTVDRVEAELAALVRAPGSPVTGTAGIGARS